MDSRPTLIENALSEPVPAIASFIGRRLTELFADKKVIECSSCGFDPQGFAAAGHCVLGPNATLGYNQVVLSWQGCEKKEDMFGGQNSPAVCNLQDGGMRDVPANAFLHIEWAGKSLDLVQIKWQTEFGAHTLSFLIAGSTDIIRAFYQAVCEWTAMPHGEVLVYAQGGWRKDKDLFDSIRNSTFDNLVLAAGLKEDLRKDLTEFFQRKEVYQRLGVPWKRGVLLIGPPGNGKTHAVKALCNSLGVPTLYVRSVEPIHRFSGEHEAIRQVFEVARKTAPCVLVLEDIDALLKPTNRSFFLNELDGFADNSGVCVLATTNYPERLDPSILDRPSRFDRKYHFDLPAASERTAYLTLWNDRQTESLRLTPSGIAEVASATDGFSFAYLKELCMSGIMAWMNAGEGAVMDEIVARQVKALRTQMQTGPKEGPEE